MTPTTTLINEEPNPNTSAAAKKRQEKLDQDIAEYLARGGKIITCEEESSETYHKVNFNEKGRKL